MDEVMIQPQSQSQSLAQATGVTGVMASSREAQEVQAAVFMAKRFPRDEGQSFARIAQSCARVGLASKAIYTYPRGGKNVNGPSIRLAEALAQSWGNIQSGVVELEQRPGESTVMAYCWDIETNTRDCRVFTVPHIRQTKNGAVPLTDPRDIYEMVANQGARRKRACILAVIPKDVIDYAVDQCAKTLSTGKTPLIERLRALTDIFREKLSVPLESIEKYMGYKLESFTELDGVTLQGIYNSIRDGQSKREDYFDLPKVQELPGESAEDAAPKTKKGSAKEQIRLTDI